MIKAYHPFFVLSLCTHILVLACAATFVVSPQPYRKKSLIVNIFQKPLPLPAGEPSAHKGGGETTAQPAPVAEVQLKPRAKPKPPAQPRNKPPTRPKPRITRQLPQAPSPPPVERATTTGTSLPGEEISESPLANGSAPAGGRNEGTSTGIGEGQGSGSGGTGSGGGGGGGPLARPDYGVNPKPPYPLIARRIGAEGVVVLRVLVRANGSVGKVVVNQSSGFTVLDESALRTVRDRWRFLPARLNGQPVESWVEVPIRFVLAGS